MQRTILMTKFAAEVLLRFLASGLTSDKSKDLHYSKVDQLPPFDLTLLFSNEFGWASYQRVLGVEFVTSADIYSIQDMLTEQSCSYLATDITPLLPLNFSSFYRLGDPTDKTRSLRPMKPKPLARGREPVGGTQVTYRASVPERPASLCERLATCTALDVLVEICCSEL